jgi:hypothetical protein
MFAQSAEGVWPSRRWCEPDAELKQWPNWAAANIPTSVDYIGSNGWHRVWWLLCIPPSQTVFREHAILMAYVYIIHTAGIVEIIQNLSFRPKVLDWVSLLQKTRNGSRGINSCIKCASIPVFAMCQVRLRNGMEPPKTWVLDWNSGLGMFVATKQEMVPEA